MRKIIPKDAVLIPDAANRVFKGVVYDVYQWEQELFDGSHTTFEMLKRPDTASVLAVVDNKVVILNEEQSHRGFKITFPGGRVDPADTSMLETAQRETFEETGYRFRNWRLIDVYQPFLKIEWFIPVYLAWDVLERSDPHHDAGEKIKMELMNFDQVKQLVEDDIGYLGEAYNIFKKCKNITDIQNLPEFQGKEVDR